MHDALSGHGAGSVGRGYGRGFGLPVLDAKVKSIEAPTVLKGLRWHA